MPVQWPVKRVVPPSSVSTPMQATRPSTSESAMSGASETNSTSISVIAPMPSRASARTSAGDPSRSSRPVITIERLSKGIAVPPGLAPGSVEADDLAAHADIAVGIEADLAPAGGDLDAVRGKPQHARQVEPLHRHEEAEPRAAAVGVLGDLEPGRAVRPGDAQRLARRDAELRPVLRRRLLRIEQAVED